MNDQRERQTSAEGDLLVGAKAIGDFLGVSRRQAYRLVHEGFAPSFKIGGTVAARRSSLNAWLEGLEKVAPGA